MHALPEILSIIYGGFFAVCLVILIFLIIRRVKIKKKEDFENRKN
jgi:hypothetical protein